jgi:hypothetical protein
MVCWAESSWPKEVVAEGLATLSTIFKDGKSKTNMPDINEVPCTPCGIPHPRPCFKTWPGNWGMCSQCFQTKNEITMS